MAPEVASRLDASVRGVLGPLLRDYARGLLEREELDNRAKHAANAIRAAHRGTRAPMILHCRTCDADLDEGECAMVAGDPYCPGCRPAALARPPAREAA